MARIEWTRLEPGDVEHVIAMLLCRENPSAQRVRPSRGDGGIDIFVPDSHGGIIVYQVKAFSSNLTSGQKRQISASLDELVETSRARGVPVSAWYLTLPLDGTPENHTWLAELVADRVPLAEWRGLAFVDGLASEYPAVIDYYLHDGKDRLLTTIDRLSSLMLLTAQPPVRASRDIDDGGGSGLSLGTAIDGLMNLHALLNETDPHYRYDFAVSAERPDVRSETTPVAIYQRGDASRCVTIRVYARCAASLEERPIPAAFSIDVSGDDGLRRQIEQFEQYGSPIEAPLGTASGDIDLPAGLGGPFERGSLSIFPSLQPDEDHRVIRMQVLDPDGEVLEQVRVRMAPPTVGINGTGVRAVGNEIEEVFELEVLTDLTNQTVNQNFRVGDLSGKSPARILPGLRFLVVAFRASNTLRVAPEYGPIGDTAQQIPEGTQPPASVGPLLDLIEALATIQEHTPTQVKVPRLDQISRAAVAHIVDAGRLLRGDTLHVPWTSHTIHLHPDVDPPTEAPVTALAFLPLTVTLDGQEIDCGLRQIQLPAARADLTTLRTHEDHQDIDILPVEGADAVVQWIGLQDEAPED